MAARCVDDLERGGATCVSFEFATSEPDWSVRQHFQKSRKLRRCRCILWRPDGSVPWVLHYAQPGHAGERATLASPVANRLFFAGEACSTDLYSTAHGALHFGRGAAEEVIAGLGTKSSAYAISRSFPQDKHVASQQPGTKRPPMLQQSLLAAPFARPFHADVETESERLSRLTTISTAIAWAASQATCDGKLIRIVRPSTWAIRANWRSCSYHKPITRHAWPSTCQWWTLPNPNWRV